MNSVLQYVLYLVILVAHVLDIVPAGDLLAGCALHHGDRGIGESVLVNLVVHPVVYILEASGGNLLEEIGDVAQHALKQLAVKDIAHGVGLEFAKVLRPVDVLKHALLEK